MKIWTGKGRPRGDQAGNFLPPWGQLGGSQTPSTDSLALVPRPSRTPARRLLPYTAWLSNSCADWQQAFAPEQAHQAWACDAW